MTTPKLHKILCVEDDADIRTIIKFALEKQGEFLLHFCASGQDALNIVESFRPDLILLDVLMPAMDGIATFKELRQLSIIKETPIIFMTAKSKSSETQRYKEMGAIDVIIKPFNASMLAVQLREIWSKYTAKYSSN